MIAAIDRCTVFRRFEREKESGVKFGAAKQWGNNLLGTFEIQTIVCTLLSV